MPPDGRHEPPTSKSRLMLPYQTPSHWHLPTYRILSRSKRGKANSPRANSLMVPLPESDPPLCFLPVPDPLHHYRNQTNLHCGSRPCLSCRLPCPPMQPLCRLCHLQSPPSAEEGSAAQGGPLRAQGRATPGSWASRLLVADGGRSDRSPPICGTAVPALPRPKNPPPPNP